MPQAVGLAAEVLGSFAFNIEEFTLLSGSGGVFNLTVDGQRIFSKSIEGRFPEEKEIINLLAQKYNWQL